MGKVSYSPGIDLVTGALDSTHQLIMRKKHLHDLTGKVDKECDTEAYLQQRKRDYKHNPPQGAELAHLQHFGQAAKLTTALLYAAKNIDQATDEQRTLIESFKHRFQAQIKGPADPQAPFDKYGKQKHYFRFDNFVRAMIYQDLKK